MKKTILTFSILISSPIFNIFAVGDDNIIEIAPSPIEHLLNIANDVSKSEKERLDACQKLMTSQDVNKDEIVSILFKMAKEFTIYQNSALDVIWNDSETKEKYLDELASLYFDIAKNTKSENLKTVIFNKFFGDQQYKIKYADALVALALDLAENPSCKQGSLDRLWQDADIKERYRPILSKALLICAQQDQNEITKLNTTHALWDNLKTRQTYHAKLIELFLDIFKNVKKENTKLNAMAILWDDPAAKKEHKTELADAYLKILKNSQDEAEKAKYLLMIWNDWKIKNEYKLDVLVPLFLKLAKDAKNERIQRDIIDLLYSSSEIKTEHQEEFVLTLFNHFKNANDQKNKSYFLSKIKDDFLIQDKYFYEYFQYKCDEHLNNKGSPYHISLFCFLKDLLKNQKIQSKHFNIISNKILSIAENEKDEDRYKAFYYLWDDLEAKEKYRSELTSILWKFCFDEYPFYAINTMWNDSQAKKEHYEDLVAILFKLSDHAHDVGTKLSIFEMLWNDMEVRNTYYNALINLLLDLSKIRERSIWHDLKTNTDAENILTNLLLDLARIEHDETQKYLAIKILLSNKSLKKEHQNELMTYLLNMIQNSSNKEIRNQSMDLMPTDLQIVEQYEAILLIAYQRRFIEEPDNIDLKLNAYLMFGASFQEKFNQFIIECWDKLKNNQKEKLCARLIYHFGVENPRVQELLLLYARDGSPRGGVVNVYTNLLLKLKDPFVHHPSVFTINLDQENAQAFHFAINPDIFNYLPVHQETLATLEDVYLILGDDIDPKIKGILDNTDPGNYGADFRKYFVAPFSEESMMLQAIIQKYKKMGLKGKEKLTKIMPDLLQCKQGKDQAIGDHYLVESEPLPLATLKNITDWFIRLQDTKNPYITDAELSSSFHKSRAQLEVLIMNHILKPDHIFRRHLTDLKTEEAQLLKGLLGSIVNFEKHIDPNNRVALGQNLKLALDILVKLSNEENFFETLKALCEVHDIYLPANKFGDQLSDISIEDLIQKLKINDIEGRGDLLTFQKEMRDFVKSDAFTSLLNNFDIESGAKLRELMRGYVSNGWSVGLLNLITLAHGEKLEDAVDAILDQTTIDKDMSFSWMNLKNLLMRELVAVKRQTINALVENITSLPYAERPHDLWYIKGLLGGIVGLRQVDKMPDFDNWHMTHEKTTSKSLQEVLDLFHEDFTVDRLTHHVKEMIDTHKLSIAEPGTGENIIWNMIRVAGKEQLRNKELVKGMIEGNIIDEASIEDKIDDLLYNVTGASHLAVALLLTKLGILNEIDVNNHPIVDNNIIRD